VQARLDRDLDLGADAVVGGDEDRVLEPCGFQIEEPAKAADLGIRAGPARRAHERLDLLDHGVAGIDIDARLGIGQTCAAFPAHPRPIRPFCRDRD
jgi:hypothetical protein